MSRCPRNFTLFCGTLGYLDEFFFHVVAEILVQSYGPAFSGYFVDTQGGCASFRRGHVCCALLGKTCSCSKDSLVRSATFYVVLLILRARPMSAIRETHNAVDSLVECKQFGH